MSRRALVLLAAALLMVVGSGAAFAIPSLGGPTGIVSVPNALVAPMGQAQAALSFQRLTAPKIVTGSEDVSSWSLQVLGGVADSAELWAAYATADDDLDTKTWGIGGKFQFAKEPMEAATVALGASFQKGSGNPALAGALGMYKADVDTDVTKLWLVATKDFTPVGSEFAAGTKILGSAGLLWAKAKDGAFDENLVRPFLGVEFVATGGTTLGLEYRWKDSDLDEKAVFSAVVRHMFAQGIVAELGTTNANQVGFGLDDQNLFVRVGYTFGLGAP